MISVGRIMHKDTGVVHAMTRIEARAPKAPPMNASIWKGITWSRVEMSLENLFVIRPIGVLSKKDIGDARTAASMVLNKFCEAAIEPYENHTTEPIKVNRPDVSPRRK